ncbi:hypothetical protein SESBI_34534 [Sesbania bispinosa]|nr:hypothetical protein SESBI_34534 [Sesbania bispinosa]
MPKPKAWFWLCLILVFLSLSSCQSRPFGTPTSLNLKNRGDGAKGSGFASLRSRLSEIEESPRMPGRLSPEGPDPKHH